MASLGKEILEQEVEQLELLHGLMQEERVCAVLGCTPDRARFVM